MRVAFFSEAVPPILDGVCRTLSNLSISLDEEQIQYKIFSGVAPSPDLPWRDSVHKVLSVPMPLYRYYRMAIPFAPKLDAALDRFKPHLLHAANPSGLGLYALSYGKRRNVPVVSSYHTNYVSYLPYYRMGELQGLGWWLLRRFHSQCRVTYVPSRSTMRKLQAQRVPRVDLWQRGVHRDQFNPRFRSEELRRSIGAESTPILLYVGRLVREKDLVDLAGAAELLSRRGVRFKLVLVGDGPLRSELRARLPEAHMTGYQTGRDLARWYASADLFVFPSTTETFGNVILEGFASGLPVVGVDAGGSSDLIQPGENGLLARPKDPHDLADKIERILSDPVDHAAMSQGALRTVRNFDWGVINRRLISSYERVIREHRSPVGVGTMELVAG